jgi:hypothetical protein
MTLKDIIKEHFPELKHNEKFRYKLGIYVSTEVTRLLPTIELKKVRENTWFVKDYPPELILFINGVINDFIQKEKETE